MSEQNATGAPLISTSRGLARRGAPLTNMKKLTATEKTVLSLIQRERATPLAQIAKRFAIKESSLRYSVKKLLDEEIIIPFTFIDPVALGFHQYTIYFSLASIPRARKKALLKFLKRSPRLAFLCELGGEYQYVACIHVSEIDEAWSYCQFLSTEFNDCIRKKEYAIHARFHLYPMRHFSDSYSPASPFSWGPKENSSEIDPTDHKILYGISQRPSATTRDLARSLGMPNSSLDYRIKKLEEAGVIRGYGYRVNHQALGLQTFRLLINARGPDAELRNSIHRYCRTAPEVHVLIETIGAHDYTIVVAVWNTYDVFEIAQYIEEQFGPAVNLVRVIPMFRVHQHFTYPHGDLEQERSDNKNKESVALSQQAHDSH